MWYCIGDMQEKGKNIPPGVRNQFRLSSRSILDSQLKTGSSSLGSIEFPKKVEDLSRDEAGKEFLDLIAKIAFGLPFDEYRKKLNEKYGDVSVDSFIKKYSEEGRVEENLTRAFSVKMISFVLDARSVMNSVSVARGKYEVVDIPKDIADAYGSRFNDALGSLDYGLKIIYTYGGQTPKGNFGELNEAFFSVDKMFYIIRAMEIRKRFFDKNGFLNEKNLEKASIHFGNLAAEVSPRQDLI